MGDGSLRTPGTGETIASDDIGGVKHQRVKVTLGTDGVGNDMGSAGDGLALVNSLPAAQMVYNGSTMSVVRGRLAGTFLASAARTADTSSATVANLGWRGIVVYLSITSVPGSGGITLSLTDWSTGAPLFMHPATAALTAVGTYGFEYYPGASTAGVVAPYYVVQRTAGVLPDLFGVYIAHSNAASYTYSVTYTLIP